MKTLEMINEWKNSDCKKKFLTKSHHNSLPFTVHNNGIGVLFESYFAITIKDPIKKSKAFTINKDNLEWKWDEIVSEYDITEAFRKSENGDCMISLASSRELNLKDTFTREEITGNWIEKFNNRTAVALSNTSKKNPLW